MVAEEVLVGGDGRDLIGFERQAEVQVQVRPLRGEDGFLGRPDLAGDEAAHLVGMARRPVGRSADGADKDGDEIRPLVGEPRVDGQDARRAGVDADVRVGMEAELHDLVEAEDVGGGDALRALEIEASISPRISASSSGA